MAEKGNNPRPQQGSAEGRVQPKAENFRGIKPERLDSLAGAVEHGTEELTSKLIASAESSDAKSSDINALITDINRLSSTASAMREELNRQSQAEEEKNRESVEKTKAEIVEENVRENEDRAEALAMKAGLAGGESVKVLSDEENAAMEKRQLSGSNIRLEVFGEKTKESGGSDQFSSYGELWDQALEDDKALRSTRTESEKQALEEFNKKRGLEGKKTVGYDEHISIQKQELEGALKAENEKRKAEGKPEIGAFEFQLEREKKEREEKSKEVALEERKKTPEYQAEQSLKAILEKIDSQIAENEKIFDEYEREGLWYKLKNREAKKSGKKAQRLRDIRAGLIAEETFFSMKKSDLAQEYKNSTLHEDDLYYMYDRANPNFTPGSTAVRLQMLELSAKTATLKEIHDNKKAKILGKLGKYGIEAGDDSQRETFSLVESGVLSAGVTQEEQIWLQMEKNKLEDSFYDGKTVFFEQELEKNARRTGERRSERLDHEIQTELEKFKMKVLEARIRVRRMRTHLENETNKENKAEINLDLIEACSKGIRKELKDLAQYEQELEMKVIATTWKNRMRQALKSKIINIDKQISPGAGSIWEKAGHYFSE